MESEDAIPNKHNRKGSRLLAVIIGLLIDIGGSVLMGFLVVIFYGIFLSMQGKTIEQIGRALSAINSNTIATIILYSIAFSLSLLAGYICARIVDYREYSCALIVAVISSLYGFIVRIGTYSLILSFGLSIIAFTCVMLGSFVYVKLKSKRACSVPRVPGRSSDYKIPMKR